MLEPAIVNSYIDVLRDELADGDLLMSHWFAENGQYKTMATRIKL